MDTGSGKTLVAVMLIKEMMERELQAQRSSADRKICFFIVNNVPLVEQQASVIRANSNAEVLQFSGASNTHKFSQNLWDEVYERANAVVCTAQILLDLLRHGYVRMNKIHLLIFDECHHARKDHPFCSIMREFYHDTSLNERPKVFGMTASPSMDIGSKLYHTAKELEDLLNCKVFTADPEQMRAFVERPKEIIVQYNPSPEYTSSTTTLTLVLQKQCSMIPKLEKEFSAQVLNIQHLGPWCVNRLWQLYVEKLADGGNLTHMGPEVKLAQGIIRSSNIPPPVCTERYLSPKVMKLIQLLRVAGHGLKDDFCGIIFVQQRDTAMALCLLIQEFEEFQDLFRAQVLTGHRDGSERVLRMSFRDQTEIISNFRKKVYNLLIATSVAEEGLDIQPCNFVVRFDPPTTVISYIQSRGRARKKDSRYIVMHELDNRAEEAMFEKIKYTESTMREWCMSLDEERIIRSALDLDDDSSQEKLAPLQTFRVPSTGALLTLDSAVALIHYYCSTLAGDEYTSLRPHFNTIPNGSSGFVCDLTLPPNAPLRVIQSDYTSTKNMARKSAAFKACEKLYSLGALTDNLLPLMSGAAQKDDSEETTAADVKDKNRSYPMATPEFWSRMPISAEMSVQLYGCVIELTEDDLQRLGGKHRFRAICLLTHRPLPCQVAPFRLYIEGAPRTVTLKSCPTPGLMKKDRLEKLHGFMLNLFHRMCRKKFQCELVDIPYLIAPLIKHFDTSQAIDTLIAWDDVDQGQKEPSPFPDSNRDDETLLNCVATLKNDAGRDFFIKRVLRECRMDDPMPLHLIPAKDITSWDEAIASEKAVPLTDKGRTFEAYFRWKYRVDCPKDDILLSVERVRKMRNHLQQAIREEDKREDEVTMVIPLSACMECPIRADVSRMAHLIPSVLYSLDSTLLVQEVRVRVGLMDTRLDLLQEAFTSTSANRDYQYERLELLGDSFLKFSSTIRLYIVNPSKDEGQLHGHRIRIISNSALLKHAKGLELFQFINTTPFHRNSWRPTRFIVDGKAWKETQTHNLSNKMLADIVEASLGAAFLSGGAKNGLHAAKALGIPFDEFSSWGDFHKVYMESKAARDREEDRSRPSLTYTQVDHLRKLEKVLGYQFKDPLLFVEAMTHASHIRNDSVCYQRLEFLGDAVLDFQVIRYYYEKYHDAPPGAITLIKDASVNNAVLGAISINWGLHKFLNHFSPALVGAIARTVVLIEDKKDKSPNKTLENEYWSDIMMPKVLGDLVESVLGAVFVDSGFDVHVVTDLFMRLIRPFLDKHVGFNSIVLHPNKVLIERLQANGCTSFGFKNEECTASASSPIFRRLGLGRPQHQQQSSEGNTITKCHFLIHGKIMATSSGEHLEEVRKEVALATLTKLNEDPELFTNLCVCPKRRGARHLSVLERYRQETIVQ
ncbi:Dicer-like protein 1 [Mortierella sp. NVP85]|nr:Dicer-like protein 1 [Mortierella sp. NVP85]